MTGNEQLLYVLLTFQNGLIRREHIESAIEAGIVLGQSDSMSRWNSQVGLGERDCEALLQLHGAYLNCFDADPLAAINHLHGVSEIRSLLESSLLAGHIEATTQVAPQPRADRAIEATEPLTIRNAGVSSESRSGQQPPRFQILRQHAKGGLGVVYVASDGDLRREVALKQIRSDREEQEVYRTKFLQEAEITGQLEHPGIVPVYASGTDSDGRLYYAMRFIRGEDMKVQIERFHQQRNGRPIDGPTLRSLLRRFLDVLDAIAYAHDRRVVHRDL